jgi:hypothetical protein
MYRLFQDSIKEFDENTIKGGPMYVKKLISKLLNMAADEFSNHGCNDFDLYVEKKNKGTVCMDWMLMRWLAAKIYNSAVMQKTSGGNNK